MSGNCEIQRNHKGEMHLYVNGVPAIEAHFSVMQMVNGEAVAIFAIPMKFCTVAEQSNVIALHAK